MSELCYNAMPPYMAAVAINGLKKLFITLNFVLTND